MENEVVSQNATSEASGEKQNKGKGLYVALGVLCVVIVGLVIGIVVVNVNNRGGSVSVDGVNCAEMQTRYDIGVCIEEFYKINSDDEQALSLYNDAISRAKARGDYELAVDLVEMEMSFMVSSDGCSDVFRFFENEVADSGYSLDNLSQLYSAAIGISVDCRDSEAMAELNQEFTEISNTLIREEV